MLQPPPATHFRRPPPSSKPEIPSSVPGGWRPRCLCRTSICPLGLALGTLPAAGFELQCSIPSPASLPLAKPPPHTEPSSKLRPSGWSSGTAKKTRRSLRPLLWLWVRATERNTCSPAPAASRPGQRRRETTSCSRELAPRQPHWPAHPMGPGGGGGAIWAPACLQARVISPVAGAGRVPPGVLVQVPRIPRSSYRGLHVPESGCIPCRSRTGPALPEVCVGNSLGSFCWQ